LAVQNGYDVIGIKELFEYIVMQNDPQTDQGCFFVEYIDTFLKLKKEASGYQDWVRTPEDEDRYLAKFSAS